LRSNKEERKEGDKGMDVYVKATPVTGRGGL
jgi:hypothetical protein